MKYSSYSGGSHSSVRVQFIKTNVELSRITRGRGRILHLDPHCKDESNFSCEVQPLIWDYHFQVKMVVEKGSKRSLRMRRGSVCVTDFLEERWSILWSQQTSRVIWRDLARLLAYSYFKMSQAKNSIRCGDGGWTDFSCSLWPNAGWAFDKGNMFQRPLIVISTDTGFFVLISALPIVISFRRKFLYLPSVVCVVSLLLGV